MNCTDCPSPVPTLYDPLMPRYMRPKTEAQHVDTRANSDVREWKTSMRDPLCRPCWDKAIEKHKREHQQ